MHLADTSVPVSRSISEILELLNEVGFQQIGQITDHGKRIIIAARDGVNFRWEIEPAKIVQALINDLPDRTRAKVQSKTPDGLRILAKLTDQAERVGWRMMRNYIFAAVVSVQYDVSSTADVFAGFLMSPAGRLGQVIAQANAEKKLNSPGFFNHVLLLEHNK